MKKKGGSKPKGRGFAAGEVAYQKGSKRPIGHQSTSKKRHKKMREIGQALSS